jgi:broad specificity phosphatase PhoE
MRFWSIMQSPLPAHVPHHLLPLAFYFLRHGETDWNAIKRIQGRTDIPLNARGEAQARAAAALLKTLTIDKIIATPLHHDEHLVEQHYGSFEGRTRDDLATELGPDALNNFWRYLPPDAEPPEAFAARILGRVLHHVQAAPKQTLLFVGHGGAMGALTRQLGMDGAQHFANAIPYRYSHDGNEWRMEALRPTYTCVEDLTLRPNPA